jgi:hypothetical protein
VNYELPATSPLKRVARSLPSPSFLHHCSFGSMNPTPPRLQLQKLSIPELHPPPTTFIAFAKLPPELRLRIWSLAANIPRKIRIGSRFSHVYYESEHLAIPEYTDIPFVLHVCQEGRREAMKCYTLCWQIRWSWRVHYEPYLGDGEPVMCPHVRYRKATYFNFTHDILLLEGQETDGDCA